MALITDSWQTIAENANKGLAPSLYNIGDTVIYESEVWGTIELRIIGFGHDELASGGKAAITFEMTHSFDTMCMDEMGLFEPTDYGWDRSHVRSTGQDVLWEIFGDYAELIQPVLKQTYVKTPEGLTLKTTTDELFLLSEYEVYGNTTYSQAEGQQYAYYRDIATTGAQKKKPSEYGSASHQTWWLRSINKADTGEFCRVASNGGIAKSPYSSSWGVSYAFCIGVAPDEPDEPTTVDYTLTYQTAHGTAPASKTVTVNEGESYTMTADDLPTLEADGYIFCGWSVNGEIVSVGYVISADTVLTAVWVQDIPASKIDPASFMAGWGMGQFIRGMRV